MIVIVFFEDSIHWVQHKKVEQANRKECTIANLDVSIKPVIEVIDLNPSPYQETDISMAPRVVGVGRGFVQETDLRLASELAIELSAALGCTRSIAEELHWLPRQSYIGISDKIIKPDLYVAVGISGQIQHIIGVRDAKLIVAIDTYENAPIFHSADYGIIGDLYEILPALTAALRNNNIPVASMPPLR